MKDEVTDTAESEMREIRLGQLVELECFGNDFTSSWTAGKEGMGKYHGQSLKYFSKL